MSRARFNDPTAARKGIRMQTDSATAPPDFGPLGILRRADRRLHVAAKPIQLPRRRGKAHGIVQALEHAADAAQGMYAFEKGMGLAAPQIGLPYRIAIVRPHGTAQLLLMNPHVIETSEDTDTQFEGCLSFFEFRGRVPRPLTAVISTQRFDGTVDKLSLVNGTARLALHEIDHLDGRLYTELMSEGDELMAYSEYVRLRDRNWDYDEA